MVKNIPIPYGAVGQIMFDSFDMSIVFEVSLHLKLHKEISHLKSWELRFKVGVLKYRKWAKAKNNLISYLDFGQNKYVLLTILEHGS